jgi:hypothetical protein
VTAIAQELSQVVGIAPACQVLGVPRSRLYVRQATSASPRPTPVHAFSAEERAAIRTVLNSAALLDEGRYLCHWRSMYRILHDFSEVRERRKQRQHPVEGKTKVCLVPFFADMVPPWFRSLEKPQNFEAQPPASLALTR